MKDDTDVVPPNCPRRRKKPTSPLMITYDIGILADMQISVMIATAKCFFFGGETLCGFNVMPTTLSPATHQGEQWRYCKICFLGHVTSHLEKKTGHQELLTLPLGSFKHQFVYTRMCSTLATYLLTNHLMKNSKPVSHQSAEPRWPPVFISV